MKKDSPKSIGPATAFLISQADGSWHIDKDGQVWIVRNGSWYKIDKETFFKEDKQDDGLPHRH
jgi:hypothetical protein